MPNAFRSNPQSDAAKEILKSAYADYMDNHAEVLQTPMDSEAFNLFEQQARREVAKLYDCMPWHVQGAFNPEYELSPITFRHIIRANIAHQEARRMGIVLKDLPVHVRYKGRTR